MKKVGKIWNNWKAEVKKHYRAFDTDEERLKYCPPRVKLEQWSQLVKYWGTREARV